MHQKVFGKVTTKKEKNNNKNEKKKKQEIGHNFWLTFYSSSLIKKKKKLYISHKKKWTDPRIGSRWLAGKPFGWRSEGNRCGESFLTPTVTFGHVSLKKTHKTLLLLLFVPDYFKANNEHLQKVDIHSQKSERTLNNDIALQEVFVHAPFLPSPSCTPFICGFS